MSKNVVNFNAGPATLPRPALERAQAELLDFAGTGISVLEHSHRGKDYEALHDHTISLLRRLMGIGDDYHVLFMQGGATAQFAFLPMNVLRPGESADYVVTGSWSKKAVSEGKHYGTLRVAATTEEDGSFRRIPKQDEIDLDENARYVHITTNNTIMGTQWHWLPETSGIPLVADMSSDILSTPIDVSKFDLIYAGAQKNIGPAGVTIVIVKKSFLDGANTNIAKVFQYTEVAKANSLLNTIPTFGIYLIRNVLEYLDERGGVPAMAEQNRAKAALLYDAIDENPGYFTCPVAREDRSLMNPVFRLPRGELEAKMIAEAAEAGFIGIKGHRSVGGLRASMYNAMTHDGVQRFVDWMKDFARANPA